LKLKPKFRTWNPLKYILLVITILLVDILSVQFVWTFAERNTIQNLPSNRPRVAMVFFDSRGIRSEQRVDAALELLRQGKVSSIYFLGGWRQQQNFHGAKEMYQYAINHGADASSVGYDTGSFDTLTNLDSICQYANRETRISISVVLVSDPLHIRRIADFFGEQSCVGDVGYWSVVQKISFPDVWLRVHKDWISRVALFCLGKWRYIQWIKFFRATNPDIVWRL